MKRSILTLLICLASTVLMAQAPVKPDGSKAAKDTTILVTMNINQFRALLGVVDANIDSKKVSKELLEFLQKSAKMEQPAEKPKTANK